MITRAELARQLRLLDAEPAQAELRLAAAELALKVALRFSDPSTVDVTEALAADEPGLSACSARLQHLAATARATRRAIVLARSEGSEALDLTQATVAEPRSLERQVRDRLDAGQRHLAGALLEVALSQHPEDVALQSLARGLRS